MLLIFIVLTSCLGIKKNCPEFDSGLVAWIPYEPGDTLILSNTELDSSLMFVIYSVVYIDHMESYKTNEKCGECQDYISLNINSNEPVRFSYGANTRHQILNFETYDFNINNTFQSFGTYNSQISEHNDYNIEGMDFSDIKIYQNVKTSDFGFYSLIVAKNIGIVALIDNNEKIWSTNNNTIKNVNHTITSGPC